MSLFLSLSFCIQPRRILGSADIPGKAQELELAPVYMLVCIQAGDAVEESHGQWRVVEVISPNITEG